MGVGQPDYWRNAANNSTPSTNARPTSGQPLHTNQGKIMTLSYKTITALQEVYFDICDLLQGNSYQSIGYENRKDFLLCQQDKLLRIERALDNDRE